MNTHHSKPVEEEDETVIRFDDHIYETVHEPKSKDSGFFLGKLFTLSSAANKEATARYLPASVTVLSLIYAYCFAHHH